MARDSERPLSDKRKGDVRSMKRVKTTIILGLSVSILAVTANAFAEDIAATTEVGMNAHISKPIAFGILYQNLVEQMRRKGLEEGRSDVGTA